MTKQIQSEESIGAMNVQNEKTRVPDAAELRAKSKSDAKDLSRSILAKFKEHGYVKIRAIGPAAIGKAFTAFTISRSQFTLHGIDAISYGSFFDVEIETTDEDTGEERKEIKTGITLTIEDR